MLDAVIGWLQSADPAHIYAILFLTAFLENVFPPIPGDVPIAFAGYLLYLQGGEGFTQALWWSSLGSVAGFMVVYWLSKTLGQKWYGSAEQQKGSRWAKQVQRFFPPSDMELLRQKFVTHGYLAVLVNRFLFGSRSVIAVMAGMMHLRTLGVFIASLVSALLWNVLLLSSGFFLGSRWQDIGNYLVLYSVPVSLLFLLLIAFSVWRFLQHRKKHHQEQH